MIELTQPQIKSLASRFTPERPGPLVGPHVIQTGHGRGFADRWPNPRTILIEAAGNMILWGDPEAVQAEQLATYLKGFVTTSPPFYPLLETLYPDLIRWPRIVLTGRPSSDSLLKPGLECRRLTAADTDHLARLSADSIWVAKTWGGPAGVAQSQCAWGAYIDDRLVSVACTFFKGFAFEDIGVATETGFRGRGLSTACAYGLSLDILARGRQPSWTTTPDNGASLAVARKLGLVEHHTEELLLAGIPAPGR